MKIISKVIIRSTDNSNNVLELSDSFLKNLTDGEYFFRAGLKEVRGNLSLSTAPSRTNRLLLNKKVLQSLHLPDNIKLNLKYENGSFSIGPILGIFISKNKIKRLLYGHQDSVYLRFQEWSKQVGGLVYFFTLEDISWDDKKIKGYYISEEGVWSARSYPMPEVIYDRCFGKDGRENSYKLREIITQKAIPIKIYNQTVKLGKLETYNHLQKYTDIENHLPVFAPYSRQELYTFLNKDYSLYIKPDKLSKGQGVLQVVKKEKSYYIKFRNPDKNQNILCNEPESLFKLLEENLMLDGDYVLQSRIDLATVMGNKFDVRVMLQKKDSEKWVVTGINARVAPSGSIITSPRSGGGVLGIREALSLSFSGREEEIIDNIESLSKKIGYRLEEKFGFLGELGIDLGVDVTGKVWLIEVNGRPLRVSFIRLQDKALLNLINRTPILMGFSLAGFSLFEHYRIPSTDHQNIYGINILPQDWPQKCLYLNKNQLEAFDLKPGKKLTLKVVFTELEVEVAEQKLNSSPSNLYLSPSAFSEVTQYNGQPLSLVSYSSNSLVLGPTLGMTVSPHFQRNRESSYEMMKTALLAFEKGIFFYSFSLDDINWSKKLVEARIFDPLRYKWVGKTLPLPQVLYNLATYPSDPVKRLKDKEANRKLDKNYDIQSINAARYFGKWQTYLAVSFFGEMRNYLPETTLLTPLKLREYLNKYKYCFIKSNYGSRGVEVMRVEKKIFSHTCKTGGAKIEEWIFPNIIMLYNFLRSKLGAQAVLQQGIELARINDRQFDMRVLAQKNINAEWVISAVNLRIAPAGGIVTNYSAGATEVLVTPDDKFPCPCITWELLQDFTIKVLYALEASWGILGEVGLDVALDVEGKLWLIEANSKPDTKGYRDLTIEEVCEQVYGLPLDYAKYLTKRMYIQ